MSKCLSVKPSPSPSDPSLIVPQAGKQCLLCLEYSGAHSEAHKVTQTKGLSKHKPVNKDSSHLFGVITRPAVNATNTEDCLLVRLALRN